MDKNEIAALLESLCERPFEGDRQPPVLPALARAHADEKPSGSIPGQAEAHQAENLGPAELASILSGTATNAQRDGFQAAASSSGAVRLEALSALAFVDGIAQAPLAAPADLVEQPLASPGSAPPRPRPSIWSQRWSHVWSHFLGRRIGTRRGQVAAACAMMLLAGGVSWSLLRGPADLGPDGLALPAATSPKEALPVSGVGPQPGAAPALRSVPEFPPAPAVEPPPPLSVPAPALTPLLAPAPTQAVANPCEPRSFAASETAARSKVESKAAKSEPNRPPKTAVAAVPDPGCVGYGGTIEAGRNPQADQGPVRAARPAAKIGRFDRDQPAAAASAPAAAPRPGTALPASPATRPSVVTQPR